VGDVFSTQGNLDEVVLSDLQLLRSKCVFVGLNGKLARRVLEGRGRGSRFRLRPESNGAERQQEDRDGKSAPDLVRESHTASNFA
jgi:hypothetical protein